MEEGARSFNRSRVEPSGTRFRESSQGVGQYLCPTLYKRSSVDPDSGPQCPWKQKSSSLLSSTEVQSPLSAWRLQ